MSKGVIVMKKLIFFLFLSQSLSIFALPDKFFGPILANFKVKNILKNNDNSRLLVTQFPNKKIYQLRTLNQKANGTCARHSIMNMIFAARSFSTLNIDFFKKNLKQIYDNRTFNILNRTLCKYLSINDNQKDGTTFHHLKMAINGIITRDFLNKYKMAKQVLPTMIHSRHFSNEYFYLDPSIAKLKYPLLFDNKFANISTSLSLIDNIVKKEHVLKKIYEFRKSDQKILTLAIFHDFKENSSHAISLLVRKVKNSFEYFVMDSHNAKPYWMKGLLNLKFIFDLPLEILHQLTLL